jgi:hypothetical protein
MGRLEEMWDQQFAFMRLLQEKRGFPKFPIDITSKEGQRFLRSVTFDAIEELIEANQHLKNRKAHRITDLPEIDRAKYIIELCDTLHFFLEIVIASGISLDELYEAYMTKGLLNTKRIEDGY